MSEEETNIEKARELLHIAATAVQIHKLASEAQPLPASNVAELARGVAWGALKRARELLDEEEPDGARADAVPGE